jgi:hypothetical protein
MDSTTARTSVPYVCVGRFVAGQSVAGTWAAVPSSAQTAPFEQNWLGDTTLAGDLTADANTRTIFINKISGVSGDITVDPGSSNATKFNQNGTTRASVTAAGVNVLGAVTSLSGDLTVDVLNNSNTFIVTQGANARMRVNNTGVQPGVDNNIPVGSASFRYTQLYAVSTTINTSDRAEKQDIAAIDDLLLDAFDAIDPRGYRWRAAVALKGDAARTHVGYIADDLAEAIRALDGDPARYAVWCEDAITEYVQTGEQQVQVGETQVQVGVESVALGDDQYAERPVFETQPVYELRPVYGDQPVLDDSGNQLRRQGLRYEQMAVLAHASMQRRFERLCSLLVSKGLVSQAEIDSIA